MLDHSDVVYGPALVEGDVAQVPVVVTGLGGDQAGYVFRLSRQTEPPFGELLDDRWCCAYAAQADHSGGDLRL